MHLDHVIKTSNKIKNERKFQSLDKAYNLPVPQIYAVKQSETNIKVTFKMIWRSVKIANFQSKIPSSISSAFKYIAVTYLCSLIKINQFRLNKGCWRHIISIRGKTNEIPSFYKNEWHEESCFTFWIWIGLCVCLSVQMKYVHIVFFQFVLYGGLYRRVHGL